MFTPSNSVSRKAARNAWTAAVTFGDIVDYPNGLNAEDVRLLFVAQQILLFELSSITPLRAHCNSPPLWQVTKTNTIAAQEDSTDLEVQVHEYLVRLQTCLLGVRILATGAIVAAGYESCLG